MPRLERAAPPCPSSRCTCVRCHEQYARRMYVPQHDHLIIRIDRKETDLVEATIVAVGDGILEATFKQGVKVVVRLGTPDAPKLLRLTPDPHIVLVNIRDVLATFTEGTPQ